MHVCECVGPYVCVWHVFNFDGILLDPVNSINVKFCKMVVGLLMEVYPFMLHLMTLALYCGYDSVEACEIEIIIFFFFEGGWVG